MSKITTSLSILSLILFSACRPSKASLHTWGKFNITSGYEFVNQVDALQSIKIISLTDTKADGNEFRVNEQDIFINTSRIDMPKEVNVDKDALVKALTSFYKVGVNEFRRKDGYYLFPVVTSLFTTERGYIYNKNLKLNQGDTVQTRQGDLDYKLVLVKQLDQKWFEYKATR